MVNNSALHETQPRNVAYDAEYAPLYSIKMDTAYINSKSSTVFAGTSQVALFLTCMALAKYKGLTPKTLKKRELNIPTSAMEKEGRWLILSLGMTDTESLSCLNDEGPIYKEAEKYANAGIEYLQELMNSEGTSNFGVYLEGELRDIAEEFISEEIREEYDSKEELSSPKND